MYFDVIYNSVSAWPAPKTAKLDRKKPHGERFPLRTVEQNIEVHPEYACGCEEKMLCSTQLVQFVTKEFLG